MSPAIFALAAAAFGIGTTEFVIMGLLPEVANSFNVSISAAGQLVTGYAMGVVVGAPALTLATGRMKRKSLLLWLTALFTVGNLLCAMAPGYWTLMAARVTTAFAHGAFFGAGSVVAGRLAPPGRSAAAIAAMFLGATIANVVGVPVGTWIGQHFGWRAPFWVIAAIGALAFAAIAALIPAAKAGAGTGSMKTELRVAARPAVLAGLAVTALGYAGTFTTFTYISPMLTDLAGYPPSSVPTVLVLFGVGLIGGNWLGGWAADRAPVAAVLASLAVLAVSLGTMGFLIHTQTGAAVAVAFLGAAAFGTVASLQAFVVRAAAGGEGLASALNIGAFNLGNAGGAWLGGVEVREAMDSRVDFLAVQGLAQRRGQHVVLARNLLANLRGRELAAVGKALQDQTGQTYRPVPDGGQARGTYRRSLQLASGRFAMLDDGVGFSLVPWRPAIEPRLGQQVSAIVRGSSVKWNLHRQLGLGA